MYFILLALLLSLSFNIYTSIKLFKNSKQGKVQKDLTLLNDLMNRDRAIIEIRRIAPQQIFLRSPKDIME